MLSILHDICLQFNLNIFVPISQLMKIFFTLSVFLTAFLASMRQGYKVTLQTPDYKSGLAYLTYYYGKNMNIEDSAVVNNKGMAVFQKNEKLLPGVYSIVFPG